MGLHQDLLCFVSQIVSESELLKLKGDSKQSDSKQSDSKQSDSKQSDSKQSDSKQSDSKQALINQACFGDIRDNYHSGQGSR